MHRKSRALTTRRLTTIYCTHVCTPRQFGRPAGFGRPQLLRSERSRLHLACIAATRGPRRCRAPRHMQRELRFQNWITGVPGDLYAVFQIGPAESARRRRDAVTRIPPLQKFGAGAGLLRASEQPQPFNPSCASRGQLNRHRDRRLMHLLRLQRAPSRSKVLRRHYRSRWKPMR
jgi:hypothetical protein